MIELGWSDLVEVIWLCQVNLGGMVVFGLVEVGMVMFASYFYLSTTI